MIIIFPWIFDITRIIIEYGYSTSIDNIDVVLFVKLTLKDLFDTIVSNYNETRKNKVVLQTAGLEHYKD